MLNRKPSFTENVNLMVNSAVNKSKFSLNVTAPTFSIAPIAKSGIAIKSSFDPG